MLQDITTTKKKYLDRRITFRINSRLIEHASEAARIDGVSLSDFYRYAIRSAASKIIGEERRKQESVKL
jgi:uncharacterized protein (DUF1778 family)